MIENVAPQLLDVEVTCVCLQVQHINFKGDDCSCRPNGERHVSQKEKCFVCVRKDLHYCVNRPRFGYRTRNVIHQLLIQFHSHFFFVMQIKSKTAL